MIDPRALRASLRAIAAGLLLAFSVPPWGWWPLAFFGVALWDSLLAGANAKRRFLRSWLMAIAWFAPSMLWISDLTLPGYPIAVVVFAAYVGIAGLVIPTRQAPIWRWIALPAAFTLAEAARSTFPFGGVPIATISMGQVSGPLAQFAKVFCAIGLTFFVGVIGVALSAAWRRRHGLAAITLAVVVVIWALMFIAPVGTNEKTLNVAVVQGGGPQGTRAADTDAREVFARHVEATKLVTTPVDLVLWPENVIDLASRYEDSTEAKTISQLAQQLNTTMIVGATELYRENGKVVRTNLSIVVNPDGSIGERYEKVRRVPFGEYVPLRSLIESLSSNADLPEGDMRKGQSPATLSTEEGKFAVAISWEIFFTNRARDGVQKGGTLLLNPTNGASYKRTQIQAQQLAASRLRSIETNRWTLQAAPTGFSALISPTGTLVERTDISAQAVLQRDVEARTGDTLATRFGPQPIIIFSFLVICAAWIVIGRQIQVQKTQASNEGQPL